MSQSLANIVLHLVFSTKDRRLFLRDEERGQLHAYITGINSASGGDFVPPLQRVFGNSKQAATA